MPFISVDTPQLRDNCLGISVFAIRFRVRLFSASCISMRPRPHQKL